MPSSVWRTGDTLFVHDPVLMRVTAVLAGAEPRLLGTTRVTASRSREMTLRGRLADGRWVGVATPSFQWEGPKGVRRLISTVGLLRPDAAGDLTPLAELPSLAYFVHNPTGDPKQGGVIGLAPFSPWMHAVVSDQAIWFGAGDGDSLVVVRGAIRRVARLPIPSRAPTRALIEAARAEGMGASPTPQARAGFEARMSPDRLPKRLPFFEGMIPGPAGEVWLQEYAGVSTAPSRYLVMGRDLRPRAWVPVPAGFRVMDAGTDHVVGVLKDEDGVESVQSYSLKR